MQTGLRGKLVSSFVHLLSILPCVCSDVDNVQAAEVTSLQEEVATLKLALIEQTTQFESDMKLAKEKLTSDSEDSSVSLMKDHLTTSLLREQELISFLEGSLLDTQKKSMWHQTQVSLLHS